MGELIAHGLPVLLLARGGSLPDWVTHHHQLPATPFAESLSPNVTPPNLFGETVVECESVTVRHAGVAILDGINWRVRAGERWAISGANGAGKSTLLSLLAGDHPQAFAQNVRLFGHRRADGTLADWKSRVGLASSELHQYFREPLTLRETIQTGFTEGLVPRRPSETERERVRYLLAEFRLLDVADRPFRTLSAGQQRLGLVTRALARGPDLLILDEPFAPLDAATMVHVRDWLDAQLSPSQTLLFVGHRREEWPRTLTHELALSTGHVVRCGPVNQARTEAKSWT